MISEPVSTHGLLVLCAGRAHRRAGEALARGLAEILPDGWRVHVTGAPDLPGVLDRVVFEATAELVGVPVCPHYSAGAPGEVLRRLYRLLAERAYDIPISVRTTWCDDAGYVTALARWIAERATPGRERPHLRFVASRPEGPPAAHDPYLQHLRRTADLVAELLDWPTDRVRVELVPRDSSPPAEPDTLLCGLPFPTDPAATTDGVDVCPPFLSYAPFLAALRGVVLHGSQPAPHRRGALRPLLEEVVRPPDAPEEPATLMLVGVSLAGPLGGGEGPPVRPTEPDAFASVRPSHRSLRSFLERVRDEEHALEALAWSTCQRVECYAWVPDTLGRDARDELARGLGRSLFGSPPESVEVNVLDGVAAWHHLLRTACGLNSDLPGDRDVTRQLESALHAACSTGSAGPRSRRMIEEALALADDLRDHTPWGTIGTGYCAAALGRVCEADGLVPDELRHVVIGGSTTSRSVLAALRDAHAVPEARLTVVYRDHHGQMKELRTAVGSGKRLRVHDYADERVLSAVADADVVYLGIDQKEPVLETTTLANLRDFTRRPLTIVDFNSFGSLDAAELPRGLAIWSAKALDQAVAAYTAILTARADFSRALSNVEERIADRLSAAVAAGRPC